MSAVPTPPDAPTGTSGRSRRRIRNFIVRVRRAGVPHEETVIIPAVALYLAAVVAGPSGWQLWLPGSAFLLIVFICGAWFGLAWRGGNPLVALLRPLYSGVLVTVSWMATHDDPSLNSKHAIVHSILQLWFFTAALFYPSFVLAGAIKDTVFRSPRIVSRKRRKFKQWIHDVWELVRNRGDTETASNLDWLVSTFIRQSINAPSLVALCIIFGGIFTYIRGGLTPLLPGTH